jgi:hypothetical protein
MGLKDKMNASLERANAGRAGKLTAKADVAAEQGLWKKSQKLLAKKDMTLARQEKRNAKQLPKYGLPSTLNQVIDKRTITKKG